MKKILLLFSAFMLIAEPASSQSLLQGLLKVAAVTAANKKSSKKSKKQDVSSQKTETNAPSKDDVTLTVSADGSTKDEATKNALRSAIEQAYGTFVSANTTILNDELVKDEIVTVSNGSIKTYKEISALQTNNGYYVTLTATVSLPQLIKYAESHGSECEFAGNTFGMEMKMFELQKKNELQALYNLTDQIVAILPSVMKYEMTIGEPTLATGKLSSIANSFTSKVDEKAKAHLIQFDYSNIKQTENKYYCIPIEIEWTTEEKDRMPKFIMNNLSAITLKYEEYESAERRNLGVSWRRIDENYDNTYYFRNTDKDIDKWFSNLYTRIENKFNEFVIKDNTGTESTFYPKKIVLCGDRDYSNGIADICPMLCTHSKSGWGIFGSGIFYNAFEYL